MKKLLFILMFVPLLFACGAIKESISIVNRQPITWDKVQVINVGQTIPEGAIFVGTVAYTDNWTKTKNCQYEDLLKKAIWQAQGMGGNILFIRTHTAPDWISTCHQITCDVYKK